MERFGCELIVIARIMADGSGLVSDKKMINIEDNKLYKLNNLSISNGTFIASGFSTFIVKLKNPPKHFR